ncbi:SusC/RagA family TonB-linked outer membrane protein [Halpernia sp.]|uniref:SusC/RagA family TonB-linked outer membrane protein n=1 Tax=Halpernia sp. TaxID=2782209 RepID=UPI003A90129A
MNLKLRVVSMAAVFFTGSLVVAQKSKKDTITSEKKIEEVVVLGYSKTSTKAKSTTSSVTVSSEVLENRPNVSVLNSIQGTAPGISVNSFSGSPGSGKFDVVIRGLSSLNGSTDPLYVVDGLITSSSQFRNINTFDIDTFSILKDAQATAIYGNRGANGVVVITTKNGRYNSALKVSYNALTSFSEYPKTKYNLANGTQLLTIQKLYGAGYGSTLSQSQIDSNLINTDWNNEFLQTGVSKQHNLSISAGGENVNNFTSLGYLESDGIVKATDFKRFTLRNNLNAKSKDGRFLISALVGIGYSKRHQLDDETNGGINANVIQNPLFGTVLSPGYLAPGNYANGQELFNAIGANTTDFRPLILKDIINGGVKNLFTETSISANVNGSYKITDDFTIGNRTGIDFHQYQRTFARSANGYLSLVVANSQGAQYGGFETFDKTDDATINSVTNVKYDKVIGNHTFSAAVYLDYLKVNWERNIQTQNGLNPLNWAFGAGTGYVPFNAATPNIYRPSVSAGKVIAGTLAFFGTLDYDYKDKYGFSAVGRRDGSYRLSPANKWENFWSFAGRWNINKEDFMSGSKFNLLKLRASLGTTGNQNLGQPGNNTNPLVLNPLIYLDQYNSTSGYQNLPGFALTNVGNNSLKWEKVRQYNIGLDFNYDGKLEGTFDYYRKLTTDLFNGIAISGITGQYNITGNNGRLENKGVEASLKYNMVRNENLRISLFANAAYNKNTILDLDTQDLTNDVVDAVGGPINQFQLYNYLGVNAANGNQLFRDINGNVTENPVASDRVLTGKSPRPKYTGGFGANADYKGFYLNVLFSWQQGGYIWDNLYSWLMDPSYAAANLNVSADLLNAWTPTNSNSNIPSVSATNAGKEGSSDRFLFKSDFIKLKNIEVGYSLPKSILKNMPIKALRIFVQGENLYTWSHWKGFDAEPVTTYSLNVYPNTKVISLGVNVDF